MARRHICDVPGCGQPRRRWQRICERCFASLPGDIRTGLIDAFRTNRKPDWRQLKKRAGAYMNFDATGQANPAPARRHHRSTSPQEAYARTSQMLGED